METRHLPMSDRPNYRKVSDGTWYHRIIGTDSWVVTGSAKIVFDKEKPKGTLQERTIKAIEHLLKVAPEDNESCDDGDGHIDTWASSEWADAKSRLREVLDEWKEQSE